MSSWRSLKAFSHEFPSRPHKHGTFLSKNHDLFLKASRKWRDRKALASSVPDSGAELSVLSGWKRRWRWRLGGSTRWGTFTHTARRSDEATGDRSFSIGAGDYMRACPATRRSWTLCKFRVTWCSEYRWDWRWKSAPDAACESGLFRGPRKMAHAASPSSHGYDAYIYILIYTHTLNNNMDQKTGGKKHICITK